MFAIRFLSVLGLAASAMAVCTNPKVTASSYTPSDSQVLAAIPFIAEFKLACDGGETPALYADIDGVLMPVTKSAEGEKYQVSWTQEVKKASTGDRSVALYDTEGFTALRKSRALGQASTLPPPLLPRFFTWLSLQGPVFWPKLRPWREGDGGKAIQQKKCQPCPSCFDPYPSCFGCFC